MPNVSIRLALPASIAGAVAIAGIAPQASAGAGCAAFRAAGGGYPAQRVGHIVHRLASCREVRGMVRAWAGRGYPNTGPALYGPWSCSFRDFVHGRPGRRAGQRRSASCTAGLNGYVSFSLTPLA